MGDKKLAEDTLTHFKGDLLNVLPLESEAFLAKLEVANLLPKNKGPMIRAKSTRVEKVSCFIQDVVLTGPHLYLPKLIGIMEKEDDNLALIDLASKMNKYMRQGNILICTYDGTIKAKHIYVG